MEKIQTICVMRQLLMAMNTLENRLLDTFGLTVNEAMVLCCIAGDTLTSSKIAENTGLSPSNTSKVLRAIESKELVTRALGDTDRRQMRFTLTPAGHQRLDALRNTPIDIPPYLRPLFN